jgi:RNA polymerase sigma-70 factor (ECF subfamily)
MLHMADEQAKANVLLARAAEGDAQAWGELLVAHEARLTRMVSFRMDARLRGRVDPADVVQDSYLEATAHRADFFRKDDVPVFLWLRGVVSNKLLEVHRHHLGAHMRDARRERPLEGRGSAEQTSAALMAQLTGHLTRPSAAAVRGEVNANIRAALGSMDEIDREVLALRHFEQLTSAEAAHVLGIQERAAAKRYVRALRRLKDVLAAMPGGLTGLRP